MEKETVIFNFFFWPLIISSGKSNIKSCLVKQSKKKKKRKNSHCERKGFLRVFYLGMCRRVVAMFDGGKRTQRTPASNHLDTGPWPASLPLTAPASSPEPWRSLPQAQELALKFCSQFYTVFETAPCLCPIQREIQRQSLRHGRGQSSLSPRLCHTAHLWQVKIE